jgi:hypothetical protein
MPSVKQAVQVIKNMGWRYVSFRLRFEMKKRLGILKKRFPASPAEEKQHISLKEWREKSSFFGVCQGEKQAFSPEAIPDFRSYEAGIYPFFYAGSMQLGKDYDWLTNPDTGYRYDSRKHWSEVQDYSPVSGDIKYVWEKSRFSFLYDVIRHDHYAGEDHAAWVFGEIASWIHANPVNCGPNYKCSQEISLRVLNWTYALHYYKDSPLLTEELFRKILHVIYWQLRHVYDNIDFSRIAVRNNHAITETLALYLGGLLYPFFPGADIWKKKGKAWFEEEIAYQIYPDGTFLQFSMNYHRVVVQLFTWAFRTADLFNEKFSRNVYEKAYESLRFLFHCQDETSGWLPNYGSNDGALFFKMNSCGYRDYRPQLHVLHVLLTGAPLYAEGEWQEDVFWFRARQIKDCNFPALRHHEGWKTFPDGGYYVLRDAATLTFIRCGSHKDRPAQADNLHLDIWHKGENILFDAGSYKYNTDRETLKYFMGSESHNTVMLGEMDQMLKGPRFIWYNWSQALNAKVEDTAESYCFEGEIVAFTYLSEGISHFRKIRKMKGKAEWVIEDEIRHIPPGFSVRQIWHTLPCVEIKPEDEHGASLKAEKVPGWRSDYYGVKLPADQYVITGSNKIITRIITA